MGVPYNHPIEAALAIILVCLFMPKTEVLHAALGVALVCAPSTWWPPQRREVDNAIAGMLTAERLAPEQVYNHVISQQIVADLRRTSEGKRSAELTRLARRMYGADAAS